MPTLLCSKLPTCQSAPMWPACASTTLYTTSTTASPRPVPCHHRHDSVDRHGTSTNMWDADAALLKASPLPQLAGLLSPRVSVPHLPPDRIALVSCEFLMLQEVPENGVTLSSLCVRYTPFGESPRVLPRSGSSLSQPLRESERLARDVTDGGHVSDAREVDERRGEPHRRGRESDTRTL